MTKQELIEFEKEVAALFERKRIRAPIHLAGGNEDDLIQVFGGIGPSDYVFSTYRSHYHALLKGVPKQLVLEQILQGRSMNLCFPQYKFYSSAIVAGCCAAAVGLAWSLKGGFQWVYCFVGDMAAETGAFHEASNYAERHRLPVWFIVENNGLSASTPTQDVWGTYTRGHCVVRYSYTQTVPHTGVGKWVTF